MQKIGFIGQGWIGKNYSDDLENRGHPVTRYALEPPYNANREAIKDCNIVFIAVPTPTTVNGFDPSIVAACLKLLSPGTTAVIKSTMVPGTTKSLQSQFPDLFVFHSPEFLVEATAKYDAANPMRNIVGIPIDNEMCREKAYTILSILPIAPFNTVMDSSAAELVKYAGNCLLYLKVIFTNILYDLSQSMTLDWQQIKEAIAADPRLGSTHLEPMHKSGRGAGGHCFIKDFAAFEEIYQKLVPQDLLGLAMLEAVEKKNVDLLTSTGKDLNLLRDCGLI